MREDQRNFTHNFHDASLYKIVFKKHFLFWNIYNWQLGLSTALLTGQSIGISWELYWQKCQQNYRQLSLWDCRQIFFKSSVDKIFNRVANSFLFRGCW